MSDAFKVVRPSEAWALGDYHGIIICIIITISHVCLELMKRGRQTKDMEFMDQETLLVLDVGDSCAEGGSNGAFLSLVLIRDCAEATRQNRNRCQGHI